MSDALKILKASAQAEADKYNGTVMWWSAILDNYEPAHNWASGYGVHYVNATGIRGFKFWPGMLSGAERALYIVDDGKVAVPHYVAGWKAVDPQNGDHGRDPSGYVLLHPFPVNPNGEMDTRGRVIDYGTWQLGPRRAYHLKVNDNWPE